MSDITLAKNVNTKVIKEHGSGVTEIRFLSQTPIVNFATFLPDDFELGDGQYDIVLRTSSKVEETKSTEETKQPQAKEKFTGEAPKVDNTSGNKLVGAPPQS